MVSKILDYPSTSKLLKNKVPGTPRGSADFLSFNQDLSGFLKDIIRFQVIKTKYAKDGSNLEIRGVRNCLMSRPWLDDLYDRKSLNWTNS